MYSVAVVDDEPLIRESLTSTVDWEQLDCEISFEAEEGNKAFDLIKEHRPDMILLDINMPGLTGLEIVRKLNEEKMTTKVIIISAYQEFDYVKKALQLGVFDYVAKPIRNSELTLIVERVIEQIILEREQKAKEQLIQDEIEELTSYFRDTKQLVSSQVIGNMILNQGHSERLLMSLSILPEFHHKHATLVIKSRSKLSDVVLNKKYILGFVEGIKERVDYKLIQTMIDGDIVLVLFFDKSVSASAYKVHAKRMSMAILDFVKEWDDVDIYIGISTLYNNTDSLSHSYKEALVATENHFFISEQDIVFNDGQDKDKRQAKFSIVHDLDYFYSTLTNGDDEELETQLKQLIAGIEDYSNGHIAVAKTLLSEICITITRFSSSTIAGGGSSVSLEDVLVGISKLNHMDEAFNYIHNHLRRSLAVEDEKQAFSPAINKVIKYIKNNYMKSISLDTTSSEVALNSSYLSRTLKKETGKNFSDIVLEERMKAAKHLLRNSNIRLNEIATQIGYKDYSYFYQVFSKSEGITPMNYRKTCKEI